MKILCSLQYFYLIWFRRYEHIIEEKINEKSEAEVEKINTEILKKLNELESDLSFSLGNSYVLSQ